MWVRLLKCINKDCEFKVRLSGGIPIWKKGTPEHLQKIPVGYEYRKYVSGYSDEEYCVKCRSIVSINTKGSPLMRRTIFSIIRRWAFLLAKIITKPDTTVICPRCGTAESFLKENMACPDCKIGKVHYDNARTIRF